ncbi:MAG: TonB-dependent receptor [Deltaproteobacteria bacterium]|nr:TonB-dependent receptor [Deltaproteobacteria bacterium]
MKKDGLGGVVSFLAGLCLVFQINAAGAEEAGGGIERLLELPVEKLLETEVATISKKKEKLGRASSAVFVITGEEIRRLGVTSIPEALRIVPGMHVGRVAGDNWAVSSRGTNDYSNNAHMLVLIDGRTVYSPLFSGLIWEMQNVMLEDVDRIEVVRGPGGSLWGANAVKGVVNIITKSSRDTQGGLVSAGGGFYERANGAVRYGGKMGENGNFRAYTFYFNRDDLKTTAGITNSDKWWQLQVGARSDWDLTDRDALTVQGDFGTGDQSALVLGTVFDRNADQGNVLTRWHHRFSDDSDSSLQLYYDRADADSATFTGIGPMNHRINTADLDFDHRFSLGERQEFVWGLGYRLLWDTVVGPGFLTWTPTNQTNHLLSGFVQDEIVLLPETLSFIAGTKIERHYYSGLEWQPTGRLVWTPDERKSVWAAASRSIRSPNRFESTASFSAVAGGVTLTQVPNANLDSENALTYELGYRTEATDWLTVDIASHLSFHNDIVTFDAGAPSGGVITQTVNNFGQGHSEGAELGTWWRLTDDWRLYGSYSFMNLDYNIDAGSSDTNISGLDEQVYNHMFNFHSSHDLPYNLQADGMLYFYDAYTDVHSLMTVDDFVRVDLRLGWKPRSDLDLSVIGQNLLGKHVEAIPARIAPANVDRVVFGRLTWEF